MAPRTLLRLRETLRQSVSANPGQPFSFAKSPIDALARLRFRPKILAPLSWQPPRLGSGRIRAGGAGVLRAAVCDHRNRDRVLRRPGAGNSDAGFRADDH